MSMTAQQVQKKVESLQYSLFNPETDVEWNPKSEKIPNS